MCYDKAHKRSLAFNLAAQFTVLQETLFPRNNVMFAATF